VPTKRDPDLSLFFDILRTLEAANIPYMIIGAYAGTMYGISRVTYDIDIVVDLNDVGIEALASAYPLPRYYADPYQMRTSVQMGIMFNIIDTERGEKADLIPLTMVSRYRIAFQNRIQQPIELPDGHIMAVWCARPEDIIVGKLMAWAEGRSRKHAADIYEILVFHYLHIAFDLRASLDEAYIDQRAAQLGQDVLEFWHAIQTQARDEAARQQQSPSAARGTIKDNL